jgi:hypothetical protein
MESLQSNLNFSFGLMVSVLCVGTACLDTSTICSVDTKVFLEHVLRQDTLCMFQCKRLTSTVALVSQEHGLVKGHIKLIPALLHSVWKPAFIIREGKAPILKRVAELSVLLAHFNAAFQVMFSEPASLMA